MYSVVVGSVAARTAASPKARRGLLFALGFVLGLASADALIGALFGFFGQAVITALAASLALRLRAICSAAWHRHHSPTSVDRVPAAGILARLPTRPEAEYLETKIDRIHRIHRIQRRPRFPDSVLV
jgi:hypothetical protein